MVEKASIESLRRWRKPKQARSLARVNRILDIAETIFVEQGYAAATTKEIAAQAEVPIGSLYQFFPDKAAILQALAERYTDLFNQQLQAFGAAEMTQLPLAEYVKRLVEAMDALFIEHSGYRATFLEITNTMPEMDEAGDDLLIQTFVSILPKLNDRLTAEDIEVIAFVSVKAIGHLHWISSGQSPEFHRRLVAETQRLMLSYLESYSAQPRSKDQVEPAE